MQYISILEKLSEEEVQTFAKKWNLEKHVPFIHPQEDFLLTSETPPIFVVADGVTLDFRKLINENKKYPNPSPSGEVAGLFCKAVVKHTHKSYNAFDVEQTTKVFKEANSKVKKYNERIGKGNISGNITGLYAATGSFVVIKDDKAYWASICDAFVAHFDKDMNVKFMSSGNCRPYAVINGEERMVEYLERGVFNLEKNDRLFVFTDGFESYVKNADFIKIFKNWSDDLKKHVAVFSQEKNLEDPERYGHERSLIAILV